MYAPGVGLINLLAGWLGIGPYRFLIDTHIMLYSLIAVDVWVSAGFNMIILLAGLKEIPIEQYEAARIDGAGRLAEIRYVTIPGLRPVFLFVIAYGFISALQVFDIPWLITASSFESYGGRSGALLFPVMDMMGEGFGSLHFGRAAAYGFILAGVIVVVTSAIYAMQRREKEG
jgi:multiple sugar transport system permease protein